MTRKSNIELIGWIGVVCIVGAFALVTFEVVSANSLSYLVLNIIGSVAIIFEAFTKKDYQPVVLNVIWAAIALIGIIRVII